MSLQPNTLELVSQLLKSNGVVIQKVENLKIELYTNANSRSRDRRHLSSERICNNIHSPTEMECKEEEKAESIDKNVSKSQIKIFINKEKTNYKYPPGLPKKRKHKTKKRKVQIPSTISETNNNNYNNDNEHNENINDTKEDNKPNINDTKEQNHKGQIKENMDGINDNGKSEEILCSIGGVSDTDQVALEHQHFLMKQIERLEKEKQQMAIKIDVLQKELKDVYFVHDEIKQKPIDESNNDLNVVTNGIINVINDIINDITNGKSHNKSLSHKENTQKIKQNPNDFSNNIDNIHNVEPYVNDHDPNECKSVDIEQDNNAENEVNILNNDNNTNDNNKIEEKHIINHQDNENECKYIDIQEITIDNLQGQTIKKHVINNLIKRDYIFLYFDSKRKLRSHLKQIIKLGSVKLYKMANGKQLAIYDTNILNNQNKLMYIETIDNAMKDLLSAQQLENKYGIKQNELPMDFNQIYNNQQPYDKNKILPPIKPPPQTDIHHKQCDEKDVRMKDAYLIDRIVKAIHNNNPCFPMIINGRKMMGLPINISNNKNNEYICGIINDNYEIAEFSGDWYKIEKCGKLCNIAFNVKPYRPIDESNNDLNVDSVRQINSIIDMDNDDETKYNKSLSDKENTDKIKQKPNERKSIDEEPTKIDTIKQYNNDENEVNIVNNYNNTKEIKSKNKIEEKHNESNEIHTQIINHQLQVCRIYSIHIT